MRHKLSNAILILGILLLLGAAGWAGYNFWDSLRAGKASRDVVDEMVDRMWDALDDDGDLASDGEGQDQEASSEADSDAKKKKHPEGPLPTKVLNDPTRTPYKNMDVEMIGGYRYIGILEIPSLGLTLPVMEEWDYQRLQISPCRYSGSYYTDDLVICAHNYTTHLGPIRQMSMGEDVYFTNVLGQTIHYITSNIKTIQPTAIEEMTVNLNNLSGDPFVDGGVEDWDLTMFTCNANGLTRCAVRCVRK